MGDLLDRLKDALADRYTAQRELAAGGMARVFLAEEHRPKRHVAIKVLDPTIAAVLGPERFLREVDLASKLTHPHILPVYSAGEADGLLYYVMPYVEGQTLRERLRREKQLPLDDALKIAREIADALSFAHSHDVIHRDIKPENILLEAGHAVVADFGIARAIDVAGGERLTETGVALGTPAYMSPEQAAGSKDLDGRSDLYSLGCVLYEMLAGQPPFTGATVESVVRQQLGAEPPSITGVRPSVPASVVAALERALAKTPADRFDPVSSFAEAITLPHGVSPTDLRPVRTALIRSKKLRIGVPAAVVIAVLGVSILRPRLSGGALDPNRILVVAFADESGREGTTSLGRMAQDYIIQVLSEAGFAEVVDPLTALAVSQNVAETGIGEGSGEILALADQAGAGTVVYGRYYADGDSVHVVTRISDARDGTLLGTVGPIVGSIGARRDLVARLGQEVVAALAPLLDRELGFWEPTAQPAAYEAYEAYNEGLEVYNDPGDYAAAARLFERAVAADSTFTRARLWAAQSYFLDGYNTMGVLGSSNNLASYAKAESLLAPLVDARAQLSPYEGCRLGFLVAWGLRQSLSGAYEAARCMVQAAPGSDDARREVALFALRLNRPTEAIERLRELDPDRGLMKQWGDGYWMFLANAYHLLGDYETELEVVRGGWQRRPQWLLQSLSTEARALAALGRLDDIAATLEAMRSLPSSWLGLGAVAVSLRTHGHRAAAQGVFDETIAWYQSRLDDTEEWSAELAAWLYWAERWDEAQQRYEELAVESPENTTYLAALGRLAARRGDRDEALRVSERLRGVEHPHLERDDTIDRARIAALLGDREAAMALLRQAIDQGAHFGHGPWLHSDIDFESLHDYPPFQEFLRPKG